MYSVAIVTEPLIEKPQQRTCRVNRHQKPCLAGPLQDGCGWQTTILVPACDPLTVNFQVVCRSCFAWLRTSISVFWTSLFPECVVNYFIRIVCIDLRSHIEEPEVHCTPCHIEFVVVGISWRSVEFAHWVYLLVVKLLLFRGFSSRLIRCFTSFPQRIAVSSVCHIRFKRND